MGIPFANKLRRLVNVVTCEATVTCNCGHEHRERQREAPDSRARARSARLHNHNDRRLSSRTSSESFISRVPRGEGKALLIVQASGFFLRRTVFTSSLARLLSSPPRFFKLWKSTSDLLATSLVDSEAS